MTDQLAPGRFPRSRVVSRAGGLVFRYHPVSPYQQDYHPREKGYETSILEALDGQTRVAHLRISFTTPELVATQFPRPLHYQAVHRGWSLDFSSPEALWRTAFRYGAIPHSLKGASQWNAWEYASPTLAEIEDDLARLEQGIAKDQAAWLEQNLTPTIAFSRVEERYQRRGLGTRLYVLAAKELGKDGKVLRASSCRTNDALALWDAMVANPRLSTSFLPGYDGALLPALDYRKG